MNPSPSASGSDEGIVVETLAGTEAQVSPPLAAGEIREEKAEAPPEVEEIRPIVGPAPLHPAMIRLPASVLGRAAHLMTGYEGFEFTDQELNDLAELWVAAGIRLNPTTQAAIGTTAMLAAKVGGFIAWKRMGKREVEAPGPGPVTPVDRMPS